MVKVVVSAEARRDLSRVPGSIQMRFYEVVERLKRWPDVSGAKPLRRELKGPLQDQDG